MLFVEIINHFSKHYFIVLFFNSCRMKQWVDTKDSVLQSWISNLPDKNYELNETMGENIIDFTKSLGFEQKETTKFKQITEQWKSNYTLYIVEKWAKLKL